MASGVEVSKGTARTCQLPCVDEDKLSVGCRILELVDVQVRHVDADQPAGLARVDVLVDGQVVADADWRACDECGVAVLEQVRTDADHRRHGYARLAVFAARDRAPGFTWSTTAVNDVGAASFWAAIGGWIDIASARYCPHMTGGLDVLDGTSTGTDT